MCDPQVATGIGEARREDFSPVKTDIAARFPGLAPHVQGAVIQRGPPQQHGGHLEFFPPHEAYNPNPGKVTVEVYNPDLTGPRLTDAVAGDMLHHLGGASLDGRNVDPAFAGMKQQFMRSITPQQRAVDQREYEHARGEGEQRDFDTWMNQSRGDAYVRGYLFPDANDEWRKQGVYTPEQTQTLEKMRRHIGGMPLNDSALAQEIGALMRRTR